MVEFDATAHLVERVGLAAAALTWARPVTPGFTLWRSM